MDQDRAEQHRRDVKAVKIDRFAFPVFLGKLLDAGNGGNVAIRSRPPTMSWFLAPPAIFPGHTAIAGTLLPPSRTVPLVPRKGV